MMLEQSIDSIDLENLRRRINNQEYQNEAIQRIALVLSNELMDDPQGGKYNESRRKR